MKKKIVIPNKCLVSKFNKKQQQNVISTYLLSINLPILRSRVIYLDVKGFGKFYTHGNKKNLNKRNYHRKYSQKHHKRKQWAKMMTAEYLLY